MSSSAPASPRSHLNFTRASAAIFWSSPFSSSFCGSSSVFRLASAPPLSTRCAAFDATHPQTAAPSPKALPKVL